MLREFVFPYAHLTKHELYPYQFNQISFVQTFNY